MSVGSIALQAFVRVTRMGGQGCIEVDVSRDTDHVLSVTAVTAILIVAIHARSKIIEYFPPAPTLEGAPEGVFRGFCEADILLEGGVTQSDFASWVYGVTGTNEVDVRQEAMDGALYRLDSSGLGGGLGGYLRQICRVVRVGGLAAKSFGSYHELEGFAKRVVSLWTGAEKSPEIRNSPVYHGRYRICSSGVED